MYEVLTAFMLQCMVQMFHDYYHKSRTQTLLFLLLLYFLMILLNGEYKEPIHSQCERRVIIYIV